MESTVHDSIVPLAFRLSGNPLGSPALADALF